MAKDILLVEDESDLASLVRFNLEREGYVCRWAADGNTAVTELQRQRPDLIILDRMLPGLSGDEVAKEVRRSSGGSAVPIIMLTAKADESDELVGFALGADDYVTKPFSIKKLIARVAALLRRAEMVAASDGPLHVGPFTLDQDRCEVAVAGRSVPLTATEFRLLRALIASRERVLSRSQLIDAALGMDAVVTDRTIDVHITAVRKKLSAVSAGRHGASPAAWIRTVRGLGYSFRPPDSSADSSANSSPDPSAGSSGLEAS